MDRKIKGLIFDIDGVLEFQGKVYPYAIETLRVLRYSGYSLRFLTNSTLKAGVFVPGASGKKDS